MGLVNCIFQLKLKVLKFYQSSGLPQDLENLENLKFSHPIFQSGNYHEIEKISETMENIWNFMEIFYQTKYCALFLS